MHVIGKSDVICRKKISFFVTNSLYACSEFARNNNIFPADAWFDQVCQNFMNSFLFVYVIVKRTRCPEKPATEIFCLSTFTIIIHKKYVIVQTSS